MAMLEIKLTISDNVAREAEAGGLLSTQSIETLLLEELRRRRVNQLFSAADRLAALPMPSLSATEVKAEIQAARQRGHTNAPLPPRQR
jgi:hypothetical protein